MGCWKKVRDSCVGLRVVIPGLASVAPSVNTLLDLEADSASFIYFIRSRIISLSYDLFLSGWFGEGETVATWLKAASFPQMRRRRP